ncbi:MAG: ribosome maturation factor RimM [Campylobacterota bacterium]
MDKFLIAKIGKTVGLKGECKLHLFTDFVQQFTPQSSFESDRGILTIKSYNPQRSTVSFVGYESVEDAKKLTNCELLSSKEQTRKNCQLNEGEMFWFDMIGLPVIEDAQELGKVIDIDRIGDIDYFKVETASAFSHIAKRFLIPNIDVYIQKKDTSGIYTQDAMGLLEQS